MTLPLHPLDQQLFTRAQALLDDEWIAHDADLAPVLPTVLARNVGQDWHKAGTFRHHLVGVARSLTLWQQPRDVRLLGLLHSVYGNAFVDLVKFDPASERARLRDLVGESAEHLVYLFCTQSRTQFVQRVLGGALEADGSLVLDKDGQRHLLTPYEVAAFIIVSMADTIEQWFSWQDDIYSRFPNVQHRPQAVHWAASLWPGPMRPTPLPSTCTISGAERVSSPDSAYISSFWPLPETPAMATISPGPAVSAFSRWPAWRAPPTAAPPA